MARVADWSRMPLVGHWLLLALLLCVSGVTCADEQGMVAASGTTGQSGPAASSSSHWPVRVDNGGRTLTFDRAPQRVVAMGQQDAEMMAALGLADRLVGYAFTADLPDTDYSRRLADVPVLAENRPSREVVLDANPDLLIGSVDQFRDEWADAGIKTYEDGVYSSQPVQDVYRKINDLADIFDVERRGDELLNSMQSKVAHVRNQVRHVDHRVSVMILGRPGSAGGSAATFGKDTMQARMLALAGGDNVFPDVTGYYPQISWESVIAADPDVLVVTYCCGERDLARKLVANKRQLQLLSAVQDGRYILIPLNELGGEMRFPEGVQTLAHGLYPDRVDEPDGSG